MNQKIRISSFVIISCLLGSVFFFSLAIYGMVTGAFKGSDEDLRSGFFLGALLFGIISVALRSESKLFQFLALTAPIWAAYLVSFVGSFVLYGSGSVGSVPFPDLLLWPWLMLLFVPLVFFYGLIGGNLSLINIQLWTMTAITAPIFLLYIYVYVLVAIRFFSKRTSK